MTSSSRSDRQFRSLDRPGPSTPSGFYQRRGKRLLDLSLTIPGTLLLLPLLLILAVMVRVFLGSPILFRQPRAGRNGQPFVLWKFRTMTDCRGADGTLLPDDMRLTRFGKFLRGTSLDELPGLWNVIRGQMSLVGPRPLLLEYNDRYDQRQRRRLESPPGITGWAQINGRNALSWEEKFELDVWYVERISLLTDLKTLWLTPWKVLKSDGISATGHVTAPVFQGSPVDHHTAPVVVLGAGGHAKVVISTLQAAGREVTLVLDDNPELWGTTLLGIPVSGPMSRIAEQSRSAAIIAVGSNTARQQIAGRFTANWTRAIHPAACIDPTVRIGLGSVVFAGAVIQPDARIGAHVIVNTSASIDHDCRVDDFAHLAPGCHLAGNVTVESAVLMGIGCRVIPGITIGRDSIVGAGATVTGPIPSGVTAVGVPARVIGSRTNRKAA